jgi:predicted kinase
VNARLPRIRQTSSYLTVCSFVPPTFANTCTIALSFATCRLMRARHMGRGDVCTGAYATGRLCAMHYPQSILLVSGAPGTGKSTVAHALKHSFPNFALLEKDRIKEALFDSLEHEGRATPDLSRKLSHIAMQVLWSLAPACPLVILEGNFRTKCEAERARFTSLPGRKLEIYCSCSLEEAARRFAARAETRHPVHTLRTACTALLTEFNQPFGLGPVIEIDTNSPFEIEELRGRVRAHWPEME